MIAATPYSLEIAFARSAETAIAGRLIASVRENTVRPVRCPQLSKTVPKILHSKVRFEAV